MSQIPSRRPRDRVTAAVEGGDAAAFEELARDPRLAAAMDSVRRMSGLPPGGPVRTFAPAGRDGGGEAARRPAPGAPPRPRDDEERPERPDDARRPSVRQNRPAPEPPAEAAPGALPEAPPRNPLPEDRRSRAASEPVAEREAPPREGKGQADGERAPLPTPDQVKPRRTGRPVAAMAGPRRPMPARGRRRHGLVIGALIALLLHLAAFLALGGGASVLRADAGADLMDTVLGGLLERIGEASHPVPPAAADSIPARRPA